MAAFKRRTSTRHSHNTPETAYIALLWSHRHPQCFCQLKLRIFVILWNHNHSFGRRVAGVVGLAPRLVAPTGRPSFVVFLLCLKILLLSAAEYFRIDSISFSSWCLLNLSCDGSLCYPSWGLNVEIHTLVRNAVSYWKQVSELDKCFSCCGYDQLM